MAYQPNPFVNPNQRGVELPPGCKDLMDVLKMGGLGRPAASSSSASCHSLNEIPRRVETFLKSGAHTQLLLLRVRRAGTTVILLMRAGVLSLVFFVPAKQESLKAAVRRVFQHAKFGENKRAMQHVSVALDSAKDAVASTILKLLIEGFGLSEDEELMCYSYQKADFAIKG